MIIKSALLRKESRAAHYRDDYKKTLPKWKKNIYCVNDLEAGFKLKTKPVPPVPKGIKKLMTKKKIDTKLLE